MDVGIAGGRQLLPMLFKTCLTTLLLYIAQPVVAVEEHGQAPTLATEVEGYAPAASCLGCHTEQAQQWKDSDHDWAMREAVAANVLGNFDNATFSDSGVEARFFKRGDEFFVNTEGEDGKPADFRILYTFGHYPLQQYLVAFPRGRLQSLTIAWDSRSKSEGGQRWYSLYPGQRFAATDPLHWTGRYQNWNAMCADCHSTRLLKNYDDKHDSFSTTWHEPNVGCQGCHGPGQQHVNWANAEKPAGQTYTSAEQVGLQVNYQTLGSQGQVEQCAFCHSRRQTLGVGQLPGHPQLDQSLPSTLRPDMYHADGQIDGEVYVYGSFTQSKMFTAGVTCTDCHNPHTAKVKLEGNGLCQQCHNEQPPVARFPSLQAKNYDSKDHHQHEAGSAGAQCVNCHMPTKTYMGVDPRRDHSMRIPRPDLADKTASPDACTSCHQDKKPEWAARAIEGWFGQPQRPPHYGEQFHAVEIGQGIALGQLNKILGDKGKPAIVRASAAERMADLGPEAAMSLDWELRDDSALVRASAIPGFASVPAAERLKLLLPLLQDPTLAVRDEATRALADVPVEQLPEGERDRFSALMKDYEHRLRSNADLPGGRLNLAVLLSRQGRNAEAESEYRQALQFDPYFTPARVNLVTMTSTSQRLEDAERLLREGLVLDNMPATDHGNLAYMLALLLVEKGDAESALDWMEKAATALPSNSRIRYNQGLLLSQMQRRDEALAALRSGLAQTPDDPDLLYTLIYLHALAGERNEAFEYVQHMREVAPHDPRLRSIEPYWKQPQGNN